MEGGNLGVMMMLKPKTVDRRMVVLGAVLIQFALGSIYAWPAFTLALKEVGWSRLDTQIVFSASLATVAIVMVIAGRHIVQWGPRRLVIISGLVLGSGYVLAGLFGGVSFSIVVLCIGLIGGAGIGMGYMVPIAVGMRWFPDHRGMITGIAVAGFGSGAMGWIKIAGEWGHLIESYGIGLTFIFYGVAFTVLVLSGSIWMTMPPKDWRPIGWTPTSLPASVVAIKEYTSREMIRTLQFGLLFITFVVSSGAGMMSIGLMKLYPVEALEASGLSQSDASAIAGTAMAVFFSIANGVGRIVWGTVSDYIGPQRALLLMTFGQGITLLLFTAMAGNEVLLYCGASLIGFNYGGNFALFPSITASTFGPNNVGQNYPLVFLASGVGAITGPILGGILGDLGNFSLAFTVCGCACLCGTVLIYLLRPLTKSGYLVERNKKIR